MESEVAAEKKEYDHAKKEYEQELREVEKTEAQLEKAAAKLRKYRRNADPEGGVYYVPGPDGGPEKPAHSGSVPPQSSAALVVAVLMSVTCAI